MARTTWSPRSAHPAAPAPAQQPERRTVEVDGTRYTELPESYWGRLSNEWAGRNLFAEGRWDECFGATVSLFQAPDGTRHFFTVAEGSPLQRQLASDRASDGSRLTSERSTVRLFGVAQTRGDRCVVSLTRVVRLPDDVDTLRAEASVAGLTPQQIRAVADRARSRGQRYNDAALLALAEELELRELDARHATLDRSDHAAALDLADRMIELGNVDGALPLLAAAESQAPTAPLRQRARDRLSDVGAIRNQGQWILFDAFKRREGFVQHNGAWVRPEALELQAARRAELELQAQEIVPRRAQSVQAARQAEAGTIIRGQNMYEVRVAAGFPDRVRHLSAPDSDGSDIIWTQWILTDGRRIYFADGLVVSQRPADTPWER